MPGPEDGNNARASLMFESARVAVLCFLQWNSRWIVIVPAVEMDSKTIIMSERASEDGDKNRRKQNNMKWAFMYKQCVKHNSVSAPQGSCPEHNQNSSQDDFDQPVSRCNRLESFLV
jgi:hypothetical protein